jgi:hypothetical protein
VHDYKKQLSEALRVCMSGAKIGFSVWGLRENIKIYPMVELIMERHGLGQQVKPTKTNYDLAANQDALRQEMLSMGYTNIKMWL